MPTATVSGLDIHFEHAGQGPPLVLLHGIGSNSRSWRHQLAGLSDEFSVVAWDAPGYGRSGDPPATELAMADYADYVPGLLDHLDVERAHLLGLSWGGVLALEFYGRYPERVRSLILADTLLGYGALPAEEQERRLRGRVDALETMTPAQVARLRAPNLLSEQAPAHLVQEVESIMAEIHPAGYRLAAMAMGSADERAVLAKVRVPTLVLWGERDRITPPADAPLFRDGIAGARLVMIPNAGHASNQEQPERFNAEVRAFLRQVEHVSKRGSGRERDREMER